MRSRYKTNFIVISVSILLICLTFAGCGTRTENNDSLGSDIPFEPIVGVEPGIEGSGDGDADINAADENSNETVGEYMEEEEKNSDKNESQEASPVILGDEQFDLYLPLLEGKRVALYTNQSGVVGNRVVSSDSGSGNIYGGDDLVPFGYSPDGSELRKGNDILVELYSMDVNISLVFTPEHGFSGTAGAGESVSDSMYRDTGIRIVSLYGGADGLNRDNLDSFDVLVVDIQDVGLRFYTYYITMFKLMEACAENNKEVIILDRPNPNGFYVDGPILKDGFKSGVGTLPIPIVHGMTIGELALMINGEGWLKTGADSCDLTVISCENYKHSDLTELICRPSPNLKDMRAVYLYPSICLFENTVMSVGRGTEYPFTIYGSPYLEGDEHYEYSFTPESIEGADNPQYNGQICYGACLRDKDLDEILSEGINLEYLIDAYWAIKDKNPDISFFGSPDSNGRYWIDLLCGTDEVRHMIEEGKTSKEIKESWNSDIESFKEKREKYILYEENRDEE